MLIPFLLLTAAEPAASTAADLLANYRRVTAVAVRCPAQAEPGEVIVCGRRRADRYRLPFTGGDGGTRLDPTPAQRTALLVPESNCEQKSVFLVGCGKVGLGLGMSSDGKARLLKPRELSP